MSIPYFFGYGSLVNRATHDFPNASKARLSGWRRTWRHTDLRPVAFLTVVPDDCSQIEGLIAHVPRDDWVALDYRERAYERVSVTQAVQHDTKQDAEIAVYAVPEHKHATPVACHPILLSYLDVVVQGYLREFGPQGADRFFASTTGWDAPVLNDRATPRYPRHQQLTAQETGFVDDHLAALSVNITF